MRTSSNTRYNTPIWERAAMRERQREARLERLRKESEDKALQECLFAPSINRKSRIIANNLQSDHNKSSTVSSRGSSHRPSTAREVFEEVLQSSHVNDSDTFSRRNPAVSFIDADPVEAPPPPPTNAPPAWAKRAPTNNLVYSSHSDTYERNERHTHSQSFPWSPSGEWLNHSVQSPELPSHRRHQRSSTDANSTKKEATYAYGEHHYDAPLNATHNQHAKHAPDAPDRTRNKGKPSESKTRRSVQFSDQGKHAKDHGTTRRDQDRRDGRDGRGDDLELSSSPSGRSVDSLLADMSLSSDSSVSNSSASDSVVDAGDAGDLSRQDLDSYEIRQEQWLSEKQRLEQEAQDIVEDLELVIQDKDEVIRSLQQALEEEVLSAQEYVETMRKEHMAEVEGLRAQLFEQSQNVASSLKSNTNTTASLPADDNSAIANPKYANEISELDALLEKEKIEGMKELETAQQELKDMKAKVDKYETELAEAREKQHNLELLHKSNTSSSVDFHTSKQQTLVLANIAHCAIACGLENDIVERESGSVTVKELLSITLSSLRILDSTDPDTGQTNTTSVPLKGDTELMELPGSLKPLRTMLNLIQEKAVSNSTVYVEKIEQLEREKLELTTKIKVLEDQVSNSATKALRSSQSFESEKNALESEYKEKLRKAQEEKASLQSRLRDYEEEREAWMEQLEGENVQLSATIEETKKAREQLVEEMTALAAERKLLNDERKAFQVQEQILLDALHQAGAALPASYIVSKNSSISSGNETRHTDTHAHPFQSPNTGAYSMVSASHMTPMYSTGPQFLPTQSLLQANPVQTSNRPQRSMSQSELTPLAVLMNTANTTRSTSDALTASQLAHPSTASPQPSVYNPSSQIHMSPHRSVSAPVIAHTPQPPISRPAPMPPVHASTSGSAVQRILNNPQEATRALSSSLSHSYLGSTSASSSSLPPAPPTSLASFVYSTSSS